MILLLNSNRWFSAISDYSLQIAIYFRDKNTQVIYGAEAQKSKMKSHCEREKIPFWNIGIHSGWRFFSAFFSLFFFLIQNRKRLTSLICMEGREQFLCAALGFFFPFLFRNISIVRVRGHGRRISNHFISRWIQCTFTTKNVFVAQFLKNEFEKIFPQCKAKNVTIYYGIGNVNQNIIVGEVRKDIWEEGKPQNLTFLILGRFDPVKGHQEAITAFFETPFQKKVTLLCIGRSENVRVSDLFQYFMNLSGSFFHGIQGEVRDHKKYILKCGAKEVILIDDFISQISDVIGACHYGLIASLGSEMVCRVGVEFLRQGVPVLSSHVGALPEIFHGPNALSYDPKEGEALQTLFLDAEKIYHHQKDKYENFSCSAKDIWRKNYTQNNYSMIEDNN